LKLIAELQHQLAAAAPDASQQRNPLLIRVEVRAGHGAGKPTAKIIAETSDLLGFAAQCLGASWAAVDAPAAADADAGAAKASL
jgi:prolyl oligopeptidase